MNRCRQGCGIHLEARAGIDVKGIVAQELFVARPAAEALPVVGTDNQREGPVGVSAAQAFHRTPRVRRQGQAQLKVADLDPGIIGHGCPRQLEPQCSVEQVVLFFQRVLRRHHEPHLIHQSDGHEMARQAQMSEMDGVERAAKYADAPHEARNACTRRSTSACATARSSLTTTVSNLSAKPSS